MAEPRLAGFLETFGLVLSLRFRLFARQITGHGVFGTATAWLISAGLSVGLGVGSFHLFAAIAGITGSPVWMAFTLGLFFFLLGLFWVIWPVIAAQVDEAYELGRFFAYPVRPGRLYLIQSLAGLAEPSVIFFYPALLGAAFGLSHSLHPGWQATFGLMLAYTLMNVSGGRCLQNLFLNLMTSRRSGEILLVAFLLCLGLSAFIPPVDASWLFGRLGNFGVSAEDLEVLANTARALGNTPPGWLAVGLAAAAAGEVRVVVGTGALMLVASGIAWLLGLVLLKRFYRGGRGFALVPSGLKPTREARRAEKSGWRLPLASEYVSAVFEKELKTLLFNPKARLLFAVPFFLLILLKTIGAEQLLLFLWGDVWAAVLLALLSLYLLSVLSGQFFINGFGYDGPAVKQIYLVPAPIRSWLLGRNLAQAVFATVQFLALGVLLFLWLPSASLQMMALPLGAFAFGLLTMLAVGNVLSVRYPRKYHFTLARRDRPVGASFMWMLSVLGACTLVTLALLSLAGAGSLGLWPVLVLPLLGTAIYRRMLPAAVRLTISEKERIIENLSS